MHIIVDHRSPAKAIEALQTFGSVHLFDGGCQTYSAVSSHPDVFMFQSGKKLVVAPNCPQETIGYLFNNAIPFIFGNKEVGKDLHNSTQYNCVESTSYFVHKLRYSDTMVVNSISNKQKIDVPQAYTRCSCIALPNDVFITSDKGIHKALHAQGIESYCFDPSGILLPPYKNGFLGGCCGLFENNFLILGRLSFLKEGLQLQKLLEQNHYSIIELYDGPLYDGGGIFFVEG